MLAFASMTRELRGHTLTSTDLHAPLALLPTGWARDVRIALDDTGTIVSVAQDAPSDGAERLAGPAMPGFPNLHSHAFQRGMAGLAERAVAPGEDFWSWRGTMYRFVAGLTPEHVEAIAAQLFVEMLSAGYTAVGEFHYVHHQADGTPYADRAELSRRVIAAAKRTGIAITHMPVLYATGGFGGQPTGDGQRRFINNDRELLGVIESLLKDHATDPDVRIALAPHSLRAVPAEMLTGAVSGFAALDPDGPIHIHIAEQTREVEDCLAWSGQRPVAWLLDHAPVDARWCLVHATHMDAGETARLADSGAVAGLCPTTEANLGDGLFPLADYLTRGGRLGIGSDSHISVDAVEELRWLEYGQRLTARRRAVGARPDQPSTGASLVAAALAGGAQALGRPCGAIAAGRRADLIVLDDRHPAFAAANAETLLDALVFAASPRPIRDVMVGGRWAVRDRRHAEAEPILEAYRTAISALTTD